MTVGKRYRSIAQDDGVNPNIGRCGGHFFYCPFGNIRLLWDCFFCFGLIFTALYIGNAIEVDLSLWINLDICQIIIEINLFDGRANGEISPATPFK